MHKNHRKFPKWIYLLRLFKRNTVHHYSINKTENSRKTKVIQIIPQGPMTLTWTSLHWINIIYIFVCIYIFIFIFCIYIFIFYLYYTFVYLFVFYIQIYLYLYLITLTDEQVQPDCDYLENRKAPEMFLNCNISRNNGQEYFVGKLFRSVVYNRLEGSDCQGCDNKVPSPFNKMGRARLHLQEKRKFPAFLWILTHH